MTPPLVESSWVLSDDLREEGWRAVGETLDWTHEDGTCSVAIEPVYTTDERRRRAGAWNVALIRRDDAGDVSSLENSGPLGFGDAMRRARALREELLAEADRTPTVRIPLGEGLAT